MALGRSANGAASPRCEKCPTIQSAFRHIAEVSPGLDIGVLSPRNTAPVPRVVVVHVFHLFADDMNGFVVSEAHRYSLARLLSRSFVRVAVYQIWYEDVNLKMRQKFII